MTASGTRIAALGWALASLGCGPLDDLRGDRRGDAHDDARDGSVDPSTGAPSDAPNDDVSPCDEVCRRKNEEAGFALSTTHGTTPLYVEVTEVLEEPGREREVRYDWGEGEGFVDARSHRYRRAGSYTVRQQVRDARGASVTGTQTVEVEEFVPVRFSRTDLAPCSHVSPDGYEVECRDWGPGGVRSDASVSPHSGVFYFEGRRLKPSAGGLGVATAAADLVESTGSSPQSMGVLGWGAIRNAGGTCTGQTNFDTRQPTAGYVIDYRSDTPTIHVIGEDATGAAEVRASCAMSVSAPLFVFYSGERGSVGYEVRINTGADTTNFPFHFEEAELRAALSESGDAELAERLVMGFGKTRAARKNAAPTLKIRGPAKVAVGEPVSLTAVAEDAEDGDLTAAIAWSDLATQHHLQPNGEGGSYGFTPDEPGRHPIRASVMDEDGRTTTEELMVEVTGALPVAHPARLVRNELTGTGVVTSPDGLSARFTAEGKYGIRANQGNYGRFWYFEVRRNVPVRNMGIGLIIEDGSLDPYDFVDVPWSMSINVMQGFWVNLIAAGEWKGDPAALDYGFAVDYRGQHPIVYVLALGRLVWSRELTDIWVPVYPMLYGNPMGPEGRMDMTINFGATPFRLDPRAILSAADVDVSGLEVGWGESAR